eukprot:TRINITY_DN813_c0_g1_i11.p1 TRINITY_DN813_c0_g1~~TRINITY_DN813_c0_g1_i11.p1  ORF type:complete len:107 (-),score=2.35 TRINITY_DN813_c0_g1_i11:6-326(-)
MSKNMKIFENSMSFVDHEKIRPSLMVQSVPSIFHQRVNNLLRAMTPNGMRFFHQLLGNSDGRLGSGDFLLFGEGQHLLGDGINRFVPRGVKMSHDGPHVLCVDTTA